MVYICKKWMTDYMQASIIFLHAKYEFHMLNLLYIFYICKKIVSLRNENFNINFGEIFFKCMKYLTQVVQLMVYKI